MSVRLPKVVELEDEIERLRHDLAGSFTHDQYHAGCNAIRNERNLAQDENDKLRARIEQLEAALRVAKECVDGHFDDYCSECVNATAVIDAALANSTPRDRT